MFWLVGVLGGGQPVWLVDPRDAQYLNTTVEELKKTAMALAGEGLIHLAADAEYATPTEALMGHRAQYTSGDGGGAGVYQADVQRGDAGRAYEYVSRAWCNSVERTACQGRFRLPVVRLDENGLHGFPAGHFCFCGWAKRRSERDGESGLFLDGAVGGRCGGCGGSGTCEAFDGGSGAGCAARAADGRFRGNAESAPGGGAG